MWNTAEWKQVRSFVQRNRLGANHTLGAPRAADLIDIAHAFGVGWPNSQRRIQNRLRWLGFEQAIDWTAHSIARVRASRSDLAHGGETKFSVTPPVVAAKIRPANRA